MNADTADLEQFLKENLTASDFETIADTLNVSKTQITKWLKGPETIPLKAVKQLAKLIWPDTPTRAFELVRDFHCGFSKINYSEALALSSAYEATQEPISSN